ncbi:unnamed protein product [Blepharisma stoltei]|uniref:Uncharacterized protein n=1 Tax=Blepharisma stoltei TaxID=1481888 RepID=A0AAU9JHC6_9CILI|nr:unnamed protein product [Blepharisma stoltei]
MSLSLRDQLPTEDGITLRRVTSISISEPSSVPWERSPRQSTILLEFSKVQFFIEEDFLYEIESSYTEPLSQDSLESLINAYKQKEKCLIIAVVRSRDTEHSTVIHNFYFHAHLLNKLLFRRKPQSGEIISRYHVEHPIQVNNPMTNLPIIGEVEYFIAKDGANTFRANFIGTDHTFANSETLRHVFESNALKPEDAELNEFSAPITDFTRFLDLDINSLEILTRLVELQRDTLLAQIKVPFTQGFLYGMLMIINFILIGTVITFSIQRFIEAREGSYDDFSFGEMIPYGLLSISSMSLDKLTCKIYRSSESRPIFMAKLLTWAILYGGLGLSFTAQSLGIVYFCTTGLMGYAFFYLLFSICLFFAHGSHKKLT